MNATEFVARFEGVIRSGDGWVARCPAHEDERASLSVAEGHDGRILIKCFAGCASKTIVEALGLEMKDLMPQRPEKPKTPHRRIVAHYDYKDADGTLLFQIARYAPKDFRQRRPDGKGGWVWHLDCDDPKKCRKTGHEPLNPARVKRVPYRLPQLLGADSSVTIYVTEGEKDADRLASSGFVVTTNPGGAGKWRPEFSEYLRGRPVVILPDIDDPGRRHAQDVARSIEGIATEIKIVNLSGLPEKGDISSWLDAGGTVEGLERIVRETLVWTPAASTDRAASSEQKRTAPPITAKRSDNRTVSSLLVDLAIEAELFHDPTGRAYAAFLVSDHRETYAVRARKFKTWLARGFYEMHRAAPASQAMNDALAVIEGLAIHEGDERDVHVRLAGQEGKIYLDLGDPNWTVIEIGVNGWTITANCPVMFRRERGIRALPVPVRGGAGIEPLWEFLNAASKNDRVLIAACLIAAFRPQGPYPILLLVGEQGSAKSTAARVYRDLIDPRAAPLRSAPRDERDLMIALNNGWVIALDNLSSMPDWLSDALCRISTGGGLATRELYSDSDETIFEGQRPVIMTAIEDIASRGDLLDRVVIVTLPSIPETQRRPESEIWPRFCAARPLILGGILDAVVAALRNVNNVKLDRLPRMADFAIWATAAEESLGFKLGSFMCAYQANRGDVNDLAIEGSLVAPVLREFIEARISWEGATMELLAELNHMAADDTKRARAWPKTPKGLSGIIRRLAPNLRRTGIRVDFLPREGSRRPIRIEWHQENRDRERSSGASQPSETSPGDGSLDDDRLTINDNPGIRPSSANPTHGSFNDGHDGHDRLDADSELPRNELDSPEEVFDL
jgi:hypothetical protein